MSLLSDPEPNQKFEASHFKADLFIHSSVFCSGLEKEEQFPQYLFSLVLVIAMIFGLVLIFLPLHCSCIGKKGDSIRGPVVQTEASGHSPIFQLQLFVQDGPMTPILAVDRQGKEFAVVPQESSSSCIWRSFWRWPSCSLWIFATISGSVSGRQSQGEAYSMKGRVKREETNEQIIDDMVRPLNQTTPEAKLFLESPVM